jgi:hypothetical protein
MTTVTNNLNHRTWDCKLCSEAHNLHDLLSVIMLIKPQSPIALLVILIRCST